MSDEAYHRPPIRVALMGLGRSMFDNHVPVYIKHPALFEVVCACDTIKDRRDRLAKHFPQCKMYRQFQDMLNERNIDLVDIATPTVNHVADAVKSLDMGRWTLLEAPMAITPDETQILRGAAGKAKNRLVIFHRGMFDADYLLARQAMNDSRLGEINFIQVRVGDYVRRDDWQAIKRLGGGACYYGMTDLVMQTLKLLPMPPYQIWSELKRLVSVGDAEDYVKLGIKTRGIVSADVEYSCAVLPGDREPKFRIKGSLGCMSVQPGAKEGVLRVVDPKFDFPRRRSSVRTPPLADLHEDIPVVELPYRLPPGTLSGPSAFWRHLYDSVRTAAPFPVSLEESMEAIKLLYLMKKNSPYGSGR